MGDPYPVVPSKPWYASTTLWLNIIAVLVAAIGIVLDQARILGLTPQAVAYFTIVVGVLNAIVRVISTGVPIQGSPAEKRLLAERR